MPKYAKIWGVGGGIFPSAHVAPTALSGISSAYAVARLVCLFSLPETWKCVVVIWLQ